MSGFEIAGIILGAFPLLVNSARYVRTGLENSKSWWLFETTFADFVSKVETQEIAYCQVLKQLAGPLDITDEEYEGLWKGANPALWGQLHIQEALRGRLDEKERVGFMQNMSEMNQAMAALQQLLPLDKVS